MKNFNRDYGKIGENGKIEFAPVPLVIGGENFWTNIPEKYLEQGYLPVVKTEKPEKEGFYYTEFFEKENEKIFVRWEEHELSPEEEVVTKKQINEAIAKGVNGID